MMRRAAATEDGGVEAVSLLLNASPDPIAFTLPAPHAARVVLIDSAKPEQGEVEIDDSYEVGPQSAVLITWRDTVEA